MEVVKRNEFLLTNDPIGGANLIDLRERAGGEARLMLLLTSDSHCFGTRSSSRGPKTQYIPHLGIHDEAPKVR
jgi:hypothetical protein